MLLSVFRRYNRAYLKANFSLVLLDGTLESLKGRPDVPLIVCVSHSSWWDLLTGILLEQGTQRRSITAMDERQLQRYRFFSWMGVAGVDRTSLRGAREFAEYCKGFLQQKNASIWLTPQGEMVDPRVRPIKCQPGVGYLIEQVPQVDVVMIAMEYTFWTDKHSVALISVSEPVTLSSAELGSRRAIVSEVEKRMELQGDRLAKLATARDASQFTVLMRGKQGIQPLYDMFKRAAALLGKRPVELRHGEVQTPRWRDSAKGNQI